MDVRVVSLFKEVVEDVKEQDVTLLRPMERLLLVGIPDDTVDETALTFAALSDKVNNLTAEFHRGRYAKVATETPALIATIETAIGLHVNEAKAAIYRLSAHAYILAAQALIILRNEFMAVQVVKCAEEAAENAGDPVLRASAIGTKSWALIRLGLFGPSETVAVAAAGRIEPSMANAAPDRLAVWGKLFTRASVAAAYDGRSAVARELLSVAHSAAVRLDGGGMDYAQYWAAFNPTYIEMAKVLHALISGDADLALRTGRNIRRTENLHLDMWLQHLLRVAEAQAITHDNVGAIEQLRFIRRLAPEYIRNNRRAHDLVLRLQGAVTVSRAKSTGLADLATFMDVQP
jgi:hypothetical protein